MRLYKILNHLHSHKDYVNIENLMNIVNVSKRTIQSDISFLMAISQNHGFNIIHKRGYGYLLTINESHLFNKYFESIKSVKLFTSVTRPNSILIYLVLQKGYTSMQQIANMFSVSNSQIRLDMERVYEISREMDIDIYSKTGKGLLIEKYNQQRYLFLLNNYNNDIVQETVEKSNFDELTLDIMKVFKKNNIIVNYNELKNIGNYIKILIYFSQNILESKVLDFSSSPVEFDLFGVLRDKYNVVLPSELIISLGKYLESKIDFNQKLNNDDVKNIIDSQLKIIDKKHHTNCYYNEEFKRVLELHIKLLIERLNKNISYENQLKDQISISYPRALDMAMELSRFIDNKYSVKSSIDEICFIATHFAAHLEKDRVNNISKYKKIAVVCASGGGASMMIKYKLASIFPNAVINEFSYVSYQEINDFEPNLIFSVIPLSDEIKSKVIYIKELLNDKDLFKILENVQMNNVNPYCLSELSVEEDLFLSPEMFSIQDADNYNDILKIMADDLEERGYAQKGFKDLIFKRESYMSTIYLNGICIPHPLETKGIKNVVKIVILKKPIKHEGKFVRAIFMVCLTKDNVEDYRKISSRLFSLMNDNRVTLMFCNSKSYEEMLSVLKMTRGVNDE